MTNKRDKMKISISPQILNMAIFLGSASCPGTRTILHYHMSSTGRL